MMNDNAAPDAAGLDDYTKALWRRKHFVVLLAIVGLILAALYANSLTREYTARAQIVVFKLPNENAFGAVSLEAEQALLASNEQIDQAIASAKSDLPRALRAGAPRRVVRAGQRRAAHRLQRPRRRDRADDGDRDRHHVCERSHAEADRLLHEADCRPERLSPPISTAKIDPLTDATTVSTTNAI